MSEILDQYDTPSGKREYFVMDDDGNTHVFSYDTPVEMDQIEVDVQNAIDAQVFADEQAAYDAQFEDVKVPVDSVSDVEALIEPAIAAISKPEPPTPLQPPKRLR